MNIKHIQYMVEIERVRSISQAAENLYVGQPNLSRILKEVEEEVGFPIFLRTTHGVRPTERGAAFLQHARNILREMESINMMSPHLMVEDRLRVCIPRSSVCFQMVADFLKEICHMQNVHAEIRECHAKKTLEMLSGGHVELGIIRFREGYEEYFQEIATSSKLTFRKLSNYEDMVLVHHSSPLAEKERLRWDDLTPFIQISHSDNYFMTPKLDERSKRQIYTVDRQAQITLLSMLPDSYMWSIPQSKEFLERHGLVQKCCSGDSRRYCEALVYNHQHTMNNLEAKFLHLVLENDQIDT